MDANKTDSVAVLREIERLERFANTESLYEPQAQRLRQIASAMRAALSAQGEEPVAWLVDGVPFRGRTCCDKTAIPLYLHPATPGSDAVTEEMVEAYANAVNEHLGSLTASEWDAERADPGAAIRRTARIGLTAALAARTGKGEA